MGLKGNTTTILTIAELANSACYLPINLQKLFSNLPKELLNIIIIDNLTLHPVCKMSKTWNFFKNETHLDLNSQIQTSVDAHPRIKSRVFDF